ncbi:MAG: hypothetical protein WC373_15270, partial [Smithella sp.]
MELTLHKLHVLVAGVFGIALGIFLLCFKRLDSLLEDRDTSSEKIRRARLLYGILAMVVGVSLISSILFGWPPLIGYIIPPP